MMEQSLRVRRIVETDAAGYYALRVRSTHGLIYPSEPAVLRELGGGLAGMREVFMRYGIERTRVWGVFDFSVLVGTLCLSRRFSPGHLDTASLWGVFVLPRYRGTAASRLLMEPLLEWCECELRIRCITTRFARGNAHARHYFERFGFEPDMETEVALSGRPCHDCDMVGMHRDL
jgi:GNAT superfamily N-acetyltransferase